MAERAQNGLEIATFALCEPDGGATRDGFVDCAKYNRMNFGKRVPKDAFDQVSGHVMWNREGHHERTRPQAIGA